MSETTQTVLEINLNYLSDNFHFLKSKLSENTKFLGVVKAGAYGSDAIVIAKKLQKLGADYLAVAYTSEGVFLRNAGVNLPIMVLHPQKQNFNDLIKFKLEPSLYNLFSLEHFINSCEKTKTVNYPVHLKFNTGLNRLGFDQKDIPLIISHLEKNSCVKIKSILSHLAASEDLNEIDFTKNQIKKFDSICETFIPLLGYTPFKHICNTSGTLNYPEAHYNMVRCGIGLYGFGNSENQSSQLTPISTLKSVISQTHNINIGESIGYNRAIIAKTAMRTATIPLGHADGISRIYGNKKGFVFINNQKAPIVGNVCMDMIMVDITHIDCHEGDEVIVFDKTFNAENLSENAGTISYELLTSISHRIKRVIIEN